MNAQLDVDWTTCNQQLLVAEFAHLRAILNDEEVTETRAHTEAMRQSIPAPASIDVLTRLFDLSDFERSILLLVAGVEMDTNLAVLCGEANGQSQQPWATFGLALAALPDPHWSAILPVEALRRHRLIELEEGAGLTGVRMKMDERVLHFIGGLNYLDHRLAPLLEPITAPTLMADTHRDIAARATRKLGSGQERLPVAIFSGDDPDGQQDVATTMAQALGYGLFRLRASDVPSSPHEQASLAELWRREAALLDAGLMLSQADDGNQEAIARFVPQLDGLLVVAGRTVPHIDIEQLHYVIDKPEAPDQRKLWHAALGEKYQPLAGTVEEMAGQYRLGARQIARAAAQIDGHDVAQVGVLLHRMSRSGGSHINELAQAIDARARWGDLVLPEGQSRALQQIAVHARHRIRVHHDWGFADKGTRGLGIATLFSGESGTGKTLAAEVLAHTLGHALYRIDLSAVVSKYIGETEKNLRKVFDAAEEIGAILLFDEADALFGKRSEVKDSHDRYANIEVSYLLQRMEAYRGLAILTTNHKAALDNAFQRRLRFVVHFPFPGAVQREAIWRTVFPDNTPLAELDYDKLARLNVTGGSIRNIALNAAFLAAESGTPVNMTQLRHAAHLEAAKREKPLTDTETRGWV